jgi:hypothetical protein
MIELSMENWKPIEKLVTRDGKVFYPYMYEVSDLGRIRTKRQRYGRPRKNTGRREPLQEYRYVNGRPDPVGYIQHDLFDKNSIRMKFRAHVIVMQTFVGLPGHKQIVCHYDDVKNNNALTNLRYDTYKANFADKKRNSKNNLIAVD